MAFIDRRGSRNRVYVYYFDKNTGKQRQVPRKLTKHLDSLPPEEAQVWVDTWAEKNGLAVDRSRLINLSDKDRLSVLWNQYQKHHASIRKRRDYTANQESIIFHRHIVQFFVGEHNRKKPESWHDLVPAFHSHLLEKGLTDQTIRYVLWALERFGKYLVFMRHMVFPFAVMTPSRGNSKISPLKTKLDPEDVLDFVKVSLAFKKGRRHGAIAEREIKLAILLGYFAGLRPSEAWALDKSDFLTGDAAERETKTLTGFRKNGLGSRLSVVVTKTWQRSKNKPPMIQDLTKSHYSRGVVNVWHLDVVRMIAHILKETPDGRLFSLGYNGMFHAWKREVLPTLKVTSHDLRRASGLYLGRVKRLDLTLLQEHLRHAEIETTMLYTREPSIPENGRRKAVQDFDDIA